jgi:TRAP-type uncharacterized transport system substrate-binding protein
MIENNNDAWDTLNNILDRIQNNDKVRNALAISLVIILVASTAFFLYSLLPKKYTLSISGGGILTNRHHLVKVLQAEAQKSGITLEIQPIHGSIETLKAVSQGKLDLALIQGGLSRKIPNVDHVAVLPPETVHILVKPDIENIEALKGKIINMGSIGGGTRVVTKNILDFIELKEGSDYIETNYSDEELVDMNPEYLPDAIVSISYMPSYLADYFVQERGYKILDIPHSQSFSFRYLWAKESQILMSTYSVSPLVPEEDINTIGVELELVANSNVNPNAISKLLGILYNSSIENIVKQSLEEESGSSFSDFPLSPGTIAYTNRNNPIFTLELLDKIKYWGGSAMAFISSLMVIVKWFRGKKKKGADNSITEESNEQVCGKNESV